MKLKDKVALVTGGAQGIGKAICQRLAAEGAKLAIADIKLDVAEKTAAEFVAAGVTAKAYQANVVKLAEVEAMVEQVCADLGSVDILVNNAGITKDDLIIRMKEEAWDAVIAVNLKGTFNCTKAVARPMMKQRAGKIVNIASIVGVMGNAGQANYSASKAGVIGLTKSTAKELASRNICANAVAPGYIQTEMTAHLSDEQKDMFLRNTPLKRPGTPQDVANVVCFLASPDSDYVTGQVIHIDGGMVM
jgi:3-oxoacyl-[acyl-carrier protein] reductase